MNIAESYLFCSTTSGACKPCFSFIKDHPVLMQEIQIIRLDTKQVRERVKRGAQFQIQTVPTLMVIYHDGDMNLYQGQQKVLTWLYMRIKTFEQAQNEDPAYAPPSSPHAVASAQEMRRIPRPLPPVPPQGNDSGLYSSSPPASLTSPETEIEYLSANPPAGSEPSSSNLDINARRQDKDNRMGDLVNVARKMEESRQAHLTSGSPPANRAPSPIKQF